jgi:hypothetical protein
MFVITNARKYNKLKLTVKQTMLTWETPHISSFPWESSYLSSVETAPARSRLSNVRTKNILDTTDIEGTKSRTRYPPVNKATEHTHIDGTKPLKLIPTAVNKPNDRHLRNDDIDYSQPFRNRPLITRHLNPLEPEYNLSKVYIPPATPPKLLRPTNIVHDITHDDSHPKRKRVYQTRDHINYHDVTHNNNEAVKLPMIHNNRQQQQHQQQQSDVYPRSKSENYMRSDNRFNRNHSQIVW